MGKVLSDETLVGESPWKDGQCALVHKYDLNPIEEPSE